jgi:hypothetical protein
MGAINWAAGREEKQKVLSLATTPAIEIADAGDFEADHGFTTSVWVKLGRRNQTGAILSRMDNAQDYRGWDLWLEGDKVGTHIADKWPDNALKVVSQTALNANEWTHLCIVYDGSRKAAGVQIYYDGQLQPVNVASDKLTGSIKTAVPFKIGQRSTDQKLQFMTIADLRLFGRGLSPQEAEQLAAADQVEAIVAKKPDERTTEDKTKAFDWWLRALDEPSRELDAKLKAVAGEEVQIKARGTIAHVMNEREDEPTSGAIR